jgi:hypothetical protein
METGLEDRSGNNLMQLHAHWQRINSLHVVFAKCGAI